MERCAKIIENTLNKHTYRHAHATCLFVMITEDSCMNGPSRMIKEADDPFLSYRQTELYLQDTDCLQSHLVCLNS